MENQDQYVQTAVNQRRNLSHMYLNQWNAQLLRGFDQLAQMSQFANLWRSFTCGYLEHLLNVEYPNTNLPMQILENPLATGSANTALEQHYIFVSVVYWKKLPEFAPKLFQNPLEADDQAFAEVHLFIPRKRLGWVHVGGSGGPPGPSPLGGVPGQIAYAPTGASGGSGGGSGGGAGKWVVGRVGSPTNWDLLNQSWDCQLAPVTQSALPTILQSTPDVSGYSGQYQLPNLGGLSSEDLQQISPH